MSPNGARRPLGDSEARHPPAGPGARRPPPRSLRSIPAPLHRAAHGGAPQPQGRTLTVGLVTAPCVLCGRSSPGPAQPDRFRVGPGCLSGWRGTGQWRQRAERRSLRPLCSGLPTPTRTGRSEHHLPTPLRADRPPFPAAGPGWGSGYRLLFGLVKLELARLELSGHETVRS